MLLKDRRVAGRRLANKLSQVKGAVVVSLLRGGVVIGDEVARKLGIPHLPLPVAKIQAPHHAELALGALCFDTVYLDPLVIGSLGLSRKEIALQVSFARTKFTSYLRRFKISKELYDQIQGKVIYLVDDGLATGASARVAALYLNGVGAKSVILAVPVAPVSFDARGFDKFVVVHRDANFRSVSQFYEHFPQITDAMVKKLLAPAPYP